ncbi:hypothetical protein Q3G72_011645 [Acer saccharum]|nr:hypothetical protein Q3G72_011645 [Acer saccharum]
MDGPPTKEVRQASTGGRGAARVVAGGRAGTRERRRSERIRPAREIFGDEQTPAKNARRAGNRPRWLVEEKGFSVLQPLAISSPSVSSSLSVFKEQLNLKDGSRSHKDCEKVIPSGD